MKKAFSGRNVLSAKVSHKKARGAFRAERRRAKAMPNISRSSGRRIAAFLAALLATALVNYLSPWLLPMQNLSTVLYALLMLVWAVSVYRRILQPDVRARFVLGACLLTLIFLLRLLRFNLSSDSSVLVKALWYAYYIPMTAVPLTALSAALCIGREETAAPRPLRSLWLLWSVLAALIMTNDLHGWMFRIAEEPGGALSHSYGALYFIVFGWIALFSVASFAVLMRRCRLSQCRKLWYFPVLAAVPGFLLLMWYFAQGGNSPELFGHKLYHFQEAYAVMFIFVWESCIQIGLLLSNTDYGKIFTLFPLNALITDEAGTVLLRSADADVPPAEKLAAARKAPVNMDEDHILHSHAIHDGAVYWIEDISAVNEINRKIASAIEYLQDEQSLLLEETRIRAERAAYETQNRLYDSLSPLVQPQLAAAQRLLTAEDGEDEALFRERLTLAMALCVYVKRRINLSLLAAKNERLSADELALAIQETLEYLRLRGVICGMERLGAAGELPAADLLLAYDFFASVVEAALPSLSALFVLVRCGGPFGIDISTETPSSRPAPHWRLRQRESAGAVMTLSEEDGLAFARLHFEREAER